MFMRKVMEDNSLGMWAFLFFIWLMWLPKNGTYQINNIGKDMMAVLNTKTGNLWIAKVDDSKDYLGVTYLEQMVLYENYYSNKGYKREVTPYQETWEQKLFGRIEKKYFS